MPVTGRSTIVVPITIGFGSAQNIERYEDWAKRASSITACDDAFWGLVNDTQLDYIYLRQGAGSLKPEALAGCGGITGVYAQNGVFIYKISRNP